MRSSVLLLYVCLVVSVSLAVGQDSFSAADANKDGHLDRSEFSSYLKKVEGALEPLLELEHDKKDGEHEKDHEAPIGGGDIPFYEGGDFMTATINSLLVILLTELGDKTFFIAAVLAMKNGRAIVYAGAMGALALMHILSCVMGVALPSLLPRAYTHFASAILFLYFGCKLLKDAHEMGEGPSDELQEVEEELINKKEGAAAEDNDVEDGDGSKTKKGSSSGAVFRAPDNFKVFTQAFTLTFLAEWGDRSQIATVALAAQKNAFGVALGGLIGHAFCTGLAVIGGRMLAARISEKTVAFSGGVLFLIFGVHSFFVGP
jgi:putative Ca2+/H+ antiporter (TMEM165/GDT1 family)